MSGLKISYILACHNEEAVIQERIRNIQSQAEFHAQGELIVAVDGSTDATYSLAQALTAPNLQVLNLARLGKARTQNIAIEKSRGDIVLITDADTKFAPAFTRFMVEELLRDPAAGAVVGCLRWEDNRRSTGVMKRLQFFVENHIRAAESRLGVLTSGSGASMAFWKKYYLPMEKETDDTDTLVPLDMVRQNRKVRYCAGALAWETPFLNTQDEMRAKIRGVSKTLTMVFGRYSWRFWIRHPGVACQFWLKHLGRWLFLPVWICAWLTGVFLVLQGARSFPFLFVASSFFLGGILLASAVSRKLGGVQAWTGLPVDLFCAHLGMMLGVLRFLRKKSQGLWSPR